MAFSWSNCSLFMLILHLLKNDFRCSIIFRIQILYWWILNTNYYFWNFIYFNIYFTYFCPFEDYSFSILAISSLILWFFYNFDYFLLIFYLGGDYEFKLTSENKIDPWCFKLDIYSDRNDKFESFSSVTWCYFVACMVPFFMLKCLDVFI